MTIRAIADWWRRKTSNTSYHETAEVVFTDAGFEVIDSGKKKESILWSEVVLIRAFKFDLLTIDQICFEFKRIDGSGVEINEGMEGYEAFLAQLPQIFKGFDEDWFPKVAHPAFATNITEVWSRSN